MEDYLLVYHRSIDINPDQKEITMKSNDYISRSDLAKRWRVSVRFIDRLRERGDLPWADINLGKRAKPLVRFALTDIQAYEQAIRKGDERR